MRVSSTSYFRRAYRKLPAFIREQAVKQEKIFRGNHFDSRLKTHKLHGKYKDYWSFSVSLAYRVIFTFLTKDEVIFIDIGDHDIYKWALKTKN